MVTTTPIPTYVDMLLPTLEALDALGGSGHLGEVDDTVIRSMGVTEEQLAVEFPPESRQKGSKIIHRLAWARTYLKKFGAVDNSERGVWTLEPEGRRYLTMDRAVADAQLRTADSEVRKKERLARLSSSPEVTVSVEPEDEVGGDEESPAGLREAYNWTDRLLRQLLQLSPAAFERLAQRLLREAGFKNVVVTGRSGDGGLDGVGVYRPSLISFPIFFQCKKYERSVGPGEVRDFRGAMAGRGEKGLLITTGTFTAEAKKEANRDGAPAVELIDGQDLCLLLKEFKVGVKTQAIEAVEIEESFFAEL